MELLDKFYKHLRTLHHFKSAQSLLHWDEQVNLPPKGAPFRAQVLATVAGRIHEVETSEELYRIVNTLSPMDSLPTDDAVNVREVRRKMLRARKLPTQFIEERSQLTSDTFHVWLTARPHNDFGSVKPYLEKIVRMCREEAHLVGFEGHPYNALLDEYECHGRIEEIQPMLLRLGDTLKGLLPRIPRFSKRSDKLLSVNSQRRLCHKIAEDLGYSSDTGRLDTAAHPFQATIGPGDARITTRWSEISPFSALFGVIHEIGHALYELGTPEEWAGTPRGSAVSLGVHESQSRFWENVVGRSRPFAEYLARRIQECAPSEASWSPEEIWEEVNAVAPSLIRVEADEVTYSLHIIVRMILEIELIEGKITVAELPEAWRALYEEYLGVHPSTDRDGVLQDVHWFGGSIGYFPTYALGNLYSACFTRALRQSIPDFDTDVAAGRFEPIRAWLRHHIHEAGSALSPRALIERASGLSLSEKPFVEYIREKFEVS